MLKIPFFKFPDPDHEADICHTVISSLTAIGTSLVKFSLRFIQLFYLLLLTDKQTDRQANKRR